jgi:hypothetical protein
MRYVIAAISAIAALYGLFSIAVLTHQGYIITSGCPNVAGAPDLCVLSHTPAHAVKVDPAPDGKYLVSIRYGESK